MCRADVFIFEMKIIKRAQELFNKKIQIICCGDFCQLPPVAPDKDKKLIEIHFSKNPKMFAFLTNEWKELNMKTVELKEIIRQSDKDFSNALNKIRLGDISGFNFIKEHCAVQNFKDVIEICTTK